MTHTEATDWSDMLVTVRQGVRSGTHMEGPVRFLQPVSAVAAR